MKTFIVGVVTALVAGAVLAHEVKPEAAGPWSTSVAVGLNLTRGNTRTMLMNGSVASEFKKEANEAGFGVEGNYGEADVALADGTTETRGNVENARANADYRRLFNARTYGYLNGDLRNDNIAEIDYRLIIGPGLGQYLLKSDTVNLGVETGVAYIKEKVAGIEDDTMALRVAEKGNVKLSATSKLWQSVEMLPAFEDFEDFLITAEVGAEAAMTTRLSLRLVFQDKFDNTPGAGLKRNDVVLIGALALKL